jgi:hypothetical protein
MAFDPQEAVDFLRLVSEAESVNRSEGLEDLRFAAGEQWPVEVQNSRTLESRPCLTINKIDSYIRQVTNNQRQQRPRIKVHPMDGVADPKIAEILTGITRHIEVNSDADQAYDTAFNFAARIGWGYFRVVTDYIREDSFDQDIYVQQIDNPFTVYFDPNSTLPDGSDAEKVLITDLMSKAAFKLAYPSADMDSFENRATGDSSADWITKEDIRIAEYFTVTREKQELLMLSDKTSVWRDELPPAEMLAAAGVTIIGKRESYRKIINWRKIAGGNVVLDEKKWPGRWIPVIPVYGDQIVIDGKRRKFGLVRFARDPQMMYNFWRTAMTESVAMAPKAKWLMAEGQDEGHENEWARANVSAYPVLRYKVTDVEGNQAPPPQRLQPEPPPEGMMEAASAISSDLQAVMGMFDPETNVAGPKSGRAIRAEQGQADQSNFHYYDNLTRSIKHLARIILDLTPKVYDKQRVMRIIGDDGKPDLVTINEKQDQEGIERIMNDVTIGNYDISMEVGPGYNSKRQEAVEAMTTMMQGPFGEELAKVAGDLIFRNMDFPGADVIADRLAAANPLSQIDEKSDIPPQAQMMIKQLQTQLQQLQQQLQAAEQEIKMKIGLEQFKQGQETKRELIRSTTKAHESELWMQEEREQVQSVERTKIHDTEVRSQTQLTVEEIKGHIALLLARLGNEAEAKEQAVDSAI